MANMKFFSDNGGEPVELRGAYGLDNKEFASVGPVSLGYVPTVSKSWSVCRWAWKFLSGNAPNLNFP